MSRPQPVALSLILLLGFACRAHLPVRAEEPQQQHPSPVVVELFTSQGCSSCPPADKLLAGLNEIANKHRLPVYCLSFHVDYWNSLGWKDPYSSKQFSQRQRRYANALKSNRVYTPQMIVNGEAEFVGSRGNDARQAIETSLARPSTRSLRIKASLSSDKSNAIVEYEVDEKQTGMLLNVALVQQNATNKIPRGENAGRELAHVQVVRVFKAMPLEATSGSITIEVPTDLEAEAMSVVVYLQELQSLRIVTASKTNL